MIWVVLCYVLHAKVKCCLRLAWQETGDRKSGQILRSLRTCHGVRFLSVKIDQRLTFEDHISILCRKTKPLKKFWDFMESKAKEILIQWFAVSNFKLNFGLACFHWMNSKWKSEKIHEQALTFLQALMTTSFLKLGKYTVRVSHLRTFFSWNL